jgi:CheY-like chemotaxis protein
MPEVLVIDDSPTQLSVREAVLRGAGFNIHSVTSAEQALEALKDAKFSSRLELILTDHILPGASGSAFVRELRQSNSDIPIVVITGFDEAESEYEGLNVIFLRKPCPPEALISRIRQALGTGS